MKLRFAFLLAASFVLAGCPPPRVGIKPGGPVPGPTPAAGPQAPALMDLKAPVSDPDYREALAAAGGAEVSRRNVEPYLTIAQYQYNHSDLASALKTYQSVLMTGYPPQPDRVQYMIGQIYYERQDYLPALAAFQNVLTKYPQSNFAVQGRQMMEFMLSYSLGLSDLKSYVENYPDSPLHCTALFQLAGHEDQGGLTDSALEHLNQLLQQCPQDPSAAAAQLLRDKLMKSGQGQSWKVGVLIPRTGKFARFGDSVLNGVVLAVEQANRAGGLKKHMTLVVKDTGSEGLMAVSEFQDLVKDDSLDAVVGPVAPSDIQAVGALANERHISMICPAASRDGLSTLGPSIFSNSMTNEMQGRAAAKFAIEKLGFKRLAILSPDDAYGQTLSNAFKKTAESMGATVVDWEAYAPGSTDYKSQLVSLGGQDPETCKETDRENARRLDELKYSISKEMGKVFLKVKDLSDAAGVEAPVSQSVALVPVVEGLSNTICPSAAKDVDGAVKDALKGQMNAVMRNDDLVKQSLGRLPVDQQGTTLPARVEEWNDMAQDLQATLIVRGYILEPTPENDWTSHPTWDYNIHLEAFWIDPVKGSLERIYQSKIPYSPLKPCGLIRGNFNYQALYLPAHAAEIPLLVSQIHFYNLSPVFLGGHLWDNPTVLQEAAKDMEGAYFTTGFYADSQQGTVKKFTDDYLAKFAKSPDLFAAQAFDAARLLLQAADPSMNREDIHNNLLRITDFDGVSGKTTFGGHGEADKLVPVIKIQGGKYQQVQ